MHGVAALSALALVCVVMAARNENRPKTFTRSILADTLRDFPGTCFASTKCATINPGETWDLKPFCGQSTCVVADDGRLVEVVEDCGPLPLENPKCQLDTDKTNATAPFPGCCPVFTCEDGAELEYPEQQTEPPQRQSRRKSSRG